jgi:hypothetical protein
MDISYDQADFGAQFPFLDSETLFSFFFMYTKIWTDCAQWLAFGSKLRMIYLLVGIP